MSYTPPPANAVDFDLQAYSAPDADSVDFELGAVTQTLLPGLFTNSNTFFSPTVTPGPVTLLPGLFSNVNAFFSPTVTPGSVTVQPALFVNESTIYLPVVQNAGPVPVEVIDNDAGRKRLKRAEKARELQEQRRKALQDAYEALLEPVKVEVQAEVKARPAVRKAVTAPVFDWDAAAEAIARSERETRAVIARIEAAVLAERMREDDDEECLLALL